MLLPLTLLLVTCSSFADHLGRSTPSPIGPGSCADAPVHAAEPIDQRARALIAALQVYDGSIRSIEWNLILHQTTADGTWIRSNIRRVGVSEQGDWYTRADYPYWDNDGTSGVMRVWRFQRANDERMYAADINLLDGKVGYNDEDMLAVASPLHLIGRYCEFENRARLHEVFASADAVMYSEPSPEEP